MTGAVPAALIVPQRIGVVTTIRDKPAQVPGWRQSLAEQRSRWFLGINGSMTAHCASDNQNRPAIWTSSLIAGASESDSPYS
jgi:hypothetical protein